MSDTAPDTPAVNPWLSAMNGEGAPPPIKKARKPREPKPPAPPPAPGPTDQLGETLEEHAIVLAHAQATLGEIVASVAEAYALTLAEAAQRVEAIKLTLLVAAHSGRAFMRRRIFDAATGRVVISRDERNLLMVLGRQHLGHTTAGTDSKVRRIVEAAEKRALGVALDGEQPAPPEEESPSIDGEDSI